MNATTIPQYLKNFAADPDFTGQIPQAFSPLLVIAAAASTLPEGHEPDRHVYLDTVAKYLGSLPKNALLASEMISLDAAKVLGIAGLATDAKTLTAAQDKLAEAFSEVAEAEAAQGKRLAAIHRLERELEDLAAKAEIWTIDFEGHQAEAEGMILEHFGNHDVSGQFIRLYGIQVLRALAPVALAENKASRERAGKELEKLRAETPQMEGAEKPKRQKENQPIQASV